MHMAKRKKRTNWATVEDLMAAQAPVNQGETSPQFEVFATMETAWQNLVDESLFGNLSRAQMQDARHIFYTGVAAAANLMIYCAGQGGFEAAARQITADYVAYRKEAEAVLRERKLLDNPPPREFSPLN
jgi:hypothetical protein